MTDWKYKNEPANSSTVILRLSGRYANNTLGGNEPETEDEICTFFLF